VIAAAVGGWVCCCVLLLWANYRLSELNERLETRARKDAGLALQHQQLRLAVEDLDEDHTAALITHEQRINRLERARADVFSLN
jgi:hypothetical protein